MAGYKSASLTASLEPTHFPGEEATRLGIYRCAGGGMVPERMREGNRVPGPSQFRGLRNGQKLIASHHVKVGGQPDELHCPYSTEPGYDRMDGRKIKAAFGPYTVSMGKSLAPSEWLVNASYWRKGYVANHALSDSDTVVDAELYGTIIGTVMVKLDSADGLCADKSYSAELDAMRRRGRKIAELSRFVIVPGQPTRSVMGAMFHFVYYYTRLLNGITDLVCEVVPRHIAGQRRLLGFAQIAGPKQCERVGVEAAVLLHRTLE